MPANEDRTDGLRNPTLKTRGQSGPARSSTRRPAASAACCPRTPQHLGNTVDPAHMVSLPRPESLHHRQNKFSRSPCGPRAAPRSVVGTVDSACGTPRPGMCEWNAPLAGRLGGRIDRASKVSPSGARTGGDGAEGPIGQKTGWVVTVERLHRCRRVGADARRRDPPTWRVVLAPNGVWQLQTVNAPAPARTACHANRTKDDRTLPRWDSRRVCTGSRPDPRGVVCKTVWFARRCGLQDNDGFRVTPAPPSQQSCAGRIWLPPATGRRAKSAPRCAARHRGPALTTPDQERVVRRTLV